MGFVDNRKNRKSPDSWAQCCFSSDRWGLTHPVSLTAAEKCLVKLQPAFQIWWDSTLKRSRTGWTPKHVVHKDIKYLKKQNPHTQRSVPSSFLRLTTQKQNQVRPTLAIYTTPHWLLRALRVFWVLCCLSCKHRRTPPTWTWLCVLL